MQRISLKLLFVTSLVHINSFSAEPSDREICRIVSAQKPSAALLTEHGERVTDNVQLGEIDFSGESRSSEFVSSANKFRLITKPYDIILEDSCSMSDCLVRTEVPSRCPDSREYLITFQLNPGKYGPGKFSSEIDFRLLSKKHGTPLADSIQFSFNRRISGIIHMPNAEILQQADVSESIAKLLAGGEEKVSLKLTNRGDRALILGKWDYLDNSEKSIALDASSCQDITLSPGAVCNLVIHNSMRKPVESKYLYWPNRYYNGDTNISLYLTPRRNGSIDYNIKN
jgi:hypothetical protein